jgi:hypothetical protein
MREALPWVAAQLGQGVSASLSAGPGMAPAEA